MSTSHPSTMFQRIVEITAILVTRVCGAKHLPGGYKCTLHVGITHALTVSRFGYLQTSPTYFHLYAHAMTSLSYMSRFHCLYLLH